MNKILSKIVISAIVFLGTFNTTHQVKAETILGDYLKDKGIEIEVSASLDFYDKYVWRGFLLDDDPVLQPGVNLSSNGFEGGFWGSWDLQNKDALSSDEVDGWIGYGFDLGFLGESFEKVGLSVGHTWYGFSESDLYSKEYYFGVTLDTFLSPYITYYNDYEDEAQGGADGNYFMAGIGHSFDLSEDYGITLDLGLEYGYNDNAFIDGKGGYVLSTAGLSVPLTEKITIAPNIGYSIPHGDLESGGGNDQKEQFFAGVSLAFNF
ncbi:MAG: hypothetical protein P9X22_03425 [Candidatus Zapsychrus exili]|nr:hypothetical protein [Candidatus Zapsychrus exili]